MNKDTDLNNPDYLKWRIKSNEQDFITGLINFGELRQRNAQAKEEFEQAVAAWGPYYKQPKPVGRDPNY